MNSYYIIQKVLVFPNRCWSSVLKMAPSSSGLGRQVFILEIRGSIPLGATKEEFNVSQQSLTE